MKKSLFQQHVPIEYQIGSDIIEQAFEHTSFGGDKPKTVILDTLLKVAGGYHNGYTAQAICNKLKLITKYDRTRPQRLTKLGQKVMYWWNEADKKNILND